MPKKSKKPNFKVNKIRKFVFRGRPFKIVWKNKPFKDGGYAECEEPSDLKENVIRIAPKALRSQKELLAAICDEIFHSHLFDIDNFVIDQLSEDLSDFLIEMGWKLPTIEPKPPNKTD